MTSPEPKSSAAAIAGGPVYEQPLNERMRTFLRLDFLYQQALYHEEREDSWSTRAAISSVVFRIPSQLLPKGGAKGSTGKLQVFGTTGASPLVTLERGRVSSGSPKVSISGTTVTVDELPENTGIAKLELVRAKGAKRLKRQLTITASVVTATGTIPLRTKVGPKPRT